MKEYYDQNVCFRGLAFYYINGDVLKRFSDTRGVNNLESLTNFELIKLAGSFLVSKSSLSVRQLINKVPLSLSNMEIYCMDPRNQF